MGNCLSDPSKASSTKASSTKTKPFKGQGHSLSSPSSSSNTPGTQQARPNGDTSTTATSPPSLGPGRPLGDGFQDPVRIPGQQSNAREAAAKAAQERANANSTRGISSANPKSGQLSAKLKEQNKIIDSGRKAPDREDTLARPSDWN
ncbi:hypothetical protein [Phaffia rhodozyma]|uniref:Uncharacterized protein n=1 Tax=Phaffia rhodozyma TaxID=264483 RepID=A0A0F7SFI0_PHARH|nr:hypothetical protein [Phaffia rhodozyma]